MASIHEKLSRNRKPRVHISYDVETEGAKVKKELPFVVGVMGDYSGNASENKKAFRDRKFINIDRDNFDEVMSRIAPQINFRVANKLSDDNSEMSVNLKFNSMEDFEPGKIVQQVEPLQKMLHTRKQLTELIAKIDRSEDLEEILENVLQNTEQLKELSEQLGTTSESDKKADASESDKQQPEAQ